MEYVNGAGHVFFVLAALLFCFFVVKGNSKDIAIAAGAMIASHVIATI